MDRVRLSLTGMKRRLGEGVQADHMRRWLRDAANGQPARLEVLVVGGWWSMVGRVGKSGVEGVQGVGREANKQLRVKPRDPSH